MSILVDTNLLVFATMSAAPQHAEAKSWLTERFEDRDHVVGLCWPVLYSVARLVSNPRIAGDLSVPVTDAWAGCMDLRRQPQARMVEPGHAHHAIATDLFATPGLKADDVPDVHLAALAIEHGLTLCSHDHGFARFASHGLRWTDPLTGRGS